MKKHIVFLVCTLTIVSSVSAQICGQRFDADLSVDYDAVVKYYHQDGTLDWECTVENTNFLLIPSCATQVSYIIDLWDDEKLLDTFIVQYMNGSPIIKHRVKSGLIRCLQTGG